MGRFGEPDFSAVSQIRTSDAGAILYHMAQRPYKIVCGCRVILTKNLLRLTMRPFTFQSLFQSTENTSNNLVEHMKTDRRDFLKASAAATLFPTPIIGAQSKDKKYRTALIGCGWWGMNILNEAMAARESTVVAMCDVDENQLNPAAAKVQELSGDQPKKYKDYRE